MPFEATALVPSASDRQAIGLMRGQPGPVYGWRALLAQFVPEPRQCLADCKFSNAALGGTQWAPPRQALFAGGGPPTDAP